MLQILRNLKDVPGVIGSFVLNNEGALVEKEMPSIVGAEAYPDIGPRISAAFTTFDAVASRFDDLLVKFSEHWLYCRRLENGVLSVFSSVAVNYPALRMATNIAATKVNPLILTTKLAAIPEPPPSPAPVAEVLVAVPKPATAPSRRYWRGQAVD